MRDGLYEVGDLLAGFDAGDPASYLHTWDLQQFIAFAQNGGPSPKTLAIAVAQAEHDAQISQGLKTFLASKTDPAGQPPRLVAVMGSHTTSRKDPTYRLIADVARDLTRQGFIIATGGGPGAMEAGHVGAYFANAGDPDYDAAFGLLGNCESLPADLGKIVDATTGDIVPGQEALYAAAGNWLKVALEAKQSLPNGVAPGESIAIPTWLYGTEPSTPFATVYAKYYQNSIREEALVAQGRVGTIYARGGGGTLREIFQAIEHNSYVTADKDFWPMIFVDPGRYWQTTASYRSDGSAAVRGVDLAGVIPQILRLALPADLWAKCSDRVLFTTELSDIHRLLSLSAPAAQARLDALLQGEPIAFLSARFRGRAPELADVGAQQ